MPIEIIVDETMSDDYIVKDNKIYISISKAESLEKEFKKPGKIELHPKNINYSI